MVVSSVPESLTAAADPVGRTQPACIGRGWLDLAWMASELLQQDDDEAAAFAAYLEKYSVHVAKADFKFNAAHFVAYKGFRER